MPGLRPTAALAAAIVAHLSVASASIIARQTSAPDVETISDCSVSSSTQYCQADSTEFRVVATPTSGDLPSIYTSCHPHGSDLYCNYDDGEVEVVLANAPATTGSASDSHDDHDHDEEAEVTAVSDCHPHGEELYCMWGSTEYSMGTTVTATSDIPAQFTDCHPHDADLFCVGPDGDDVAAHAEGAESDSSDSHDDHDDEGEPDGEHCHFHAGVEHCVGAGESENEGTRSCERQDRDYNVNLRVGLLFVILVTSAMGVFGPIFLIRILPSKLQVVFLIVKQFGTGVIISTAFIHLYTHAELMFSNPCLEGVEFEGTTAAIVMGGIFMSFLVEYIGQRIVRKKMAQGVSAKSWFRPETVSILVLEAGIVFHSILIGITLVVAGDSFFLTLFVVILFHQVFEGLALGSRIAALGTRAVAHVGGHGHGGHLGMPTHAAAPTSPHTKGPEDGGPVPEEPTSSGASSDTLEKTVHFSLRKKLLLASIFAFITPIGMAIGIGALNQFNGNDPSTILAIGILNALSAGILIWVGVVEMWAEDWMFGGSELMESGWIVTTLSMFGLAAGMALMGFLGMWA